MVFMMPTMMFIMNSITLLVVWVGANQIADSTMQVGDMMAFMQYAMQIIMSFLMISMMFIMIPRASVSGDRIQEVLAVEPSIVDPVQPKTLPTNTRPVLKFNNVSFRYEGADEDVLHDIDFTAMPGQTTAFIGSTGSGKSTLINLIPRFFDVTKGSITIDDIDIREITQFDLRNHIGYVPQKGVLFSGTIASNLRYGDKTATDDDLSIAADVAQATGLLNQTPEGLYREISQGGSNVSGGQKQRLSIARALTRKPDIYIFDDSFSALDYKTDLALRKALKNYTGDSTVLIVAQRINTIMQAEQIIVLDEGKVVGKGTHQELLKSCECYREIASSQLSEEELSL
jgi:ATP-binding cassette subfamily B protein